MRQVSDDGIFLGLACHDGMLPMTALVCTLTVQPGRFLVTVFSCGWLS